MIRNFIALVAAALVAFSPLALATDANRATQAELESVKGIGPGLSSKILKARVAGSFKNWGDLVERVGGVGPGNAAAEAPHPWDRRLRQLGDRWAQVAADAV